MKSATVKGSLRPRKGVCDESVTSLRKVCNQERKSATGKASLQPGKRVSDYERESAKCL